MRGAQPHIRDILERAELCAAWVAEGVEVYNHPGIRGIERRYAMRLAFLEIAEAARRLPEEFRAAHPEIPWAEIRGMRNIVAHAYQHVNDRILWRVIAEALPDVADRLRAAAE